MALFARKKEKEKKEDSVKNTEAPKSASSSTIKVSATKELRAKPTKTAEPKKNKASSRKDVHLERVLKHPRITEKATMATGSGVYVFDIDSRANKKEVATAVAHVYNVTPKKVRIAPIPYKQVSSRRRGVFGVSGGGKKAYVYLKDGDSISII